MALGKAIQFIRQARSDAELRKACYAVSSKTELRKILNFDDGEFEDAFTMELVKCQSAEEADGMHQLRDWFKLIIS